MGKNVVAARLADGCEVQIARTIRTRTAAHGHVGWTDPDFTCGRIDRAGGLRRAAGLTADADPDVAAPAGA